MTHDIETFRLRWLARRLRISISHARLVLELHLGSGRAA